MLIVQELMIEIMFENTNTQIIGSEFYNISPNGGVEGGEGKQYFFWTSYCWGLC